MAWFDRFRSIKSIRKEQEELRGEIQEARAMIEKLEQECDGLEELYARNQLRIEELRELIETHMQPKQ